MYGETGVQSDFNTSTFAHLYLKAAINYIRKDMKYVCLLTNVLYIHYSDMTNVSNHEIDYHTLQHTFG